MWGENQDLVQKILKFGAYFYSLTSNCFIEIESLYIIILKKIYKCDHSPSLLGLSPSLLVPRAFGDANTPVVLLASIEVYCFTCECWDSTFGGYYPDETTLIKHIETYSLRVSWKECFS